MRKTENSSVEHYNRDYYYTPHDQNSHDHSNNINGQYKIIITASRTARCDLRARTLNLTRRPMTKINTSSIGIIKLTGSRPLTTTRRHRGAMRADTLCDFINVLICALPLRAEIDDEIVACACATAPWIDSMGGSPQLLLVNMNIAAQRMCYFQHLRVRDIRRRGGNE